MEEKKYDVEATASAVMSVVRRGDLSGLTPEEKTRYLIALCESLGLNPMTQPIQFLKFQGREIAYVTRGATDQLAARAGLSRTIVEGPDLRDYGGTKLVYCKAEGRLPNGRVDSSIATIRGAIDENILMKAESKAKRRVTLSILGLGMLTEDEAEDMDAGQQPASSGKSSSRKAAPVDDATIWFSGMTDDETAAEYIETAVAVLRENFRQDPERLADELASFFDRTKDRFPQVSADALFSRLKMVAKLYSVATVFQKAVQARVSSQAAATRAAISAAAPQAPAAAPAGAPTASSAPATTDRPSSRLDAVLEALAGAEDPHTLSGILLHDAPKDASVAEKKELFSAACGRLASIRAEAGVPTDAASVTAAMRAVIEEHKAVEAEREQARAKARDAFERGEAYVDPFEPPKAEASSDAPLSDEQWRQHLAEKGALDGGIAGAFAKRAAEFKADGTYDDRFQATVDAVNAVRKRGPVDAATFIRDVMANASKRRSQPRA